MVYIERQNGPNLRWPAIIKKMVADRRTAHFTLYEAVQPSPLRRSINVLPCQRTFRHFRRILLRITPCTYVCAYVPTQPHTQLQILKACHSDGTVGHLGRTRPLTRCARGTTGLRFSTTLNILRVSLVPHNHGYTSMHVRYL